MAKIYNEIVIDMNPESSTFEEVIHEDSYEYEGDMMLMRRKISLSDDAIQARKSKSFFDLAEIIKAQQEKFSKQAGKAKLLDKFGDVIQSVGSLFGVKGIAIGTGLDVLIDYFSGKNLLKGKKAGDPGAIKKMETPWTQGGCSEEFSTIKKEATPSFWSELLQGGVEGLKSYAVGEVTGGDYPLGEGSKFDTWLSNLEFNMHSFGDSGGYTAGKGKPPGFKKGGYVPKKYYGGGSVSGNPTIVDYFSKQNKTLGGSNKKSLAEMLGRR